MPVYLEYALKVSISLAVVFLFYALLLKKMTWYRWNRYFLLLFSSVSFVVPFINVSLFVQLHEKRTVSFVDAIPSIHAIEITGESNNPAMTAYWQILAGVFLIVSIALFFRLFIQLLSIQKIKSKSTLIIGESEKIYNTSQQILPFSFLNNIFINTNNYNDQELQKILKHERVHVRERHSIDMLVGEIICILNWFNPFAWMIKNAIRENLEFIADEAVVIEGVDKKNYQYLLLKVTGNSPSPIVSSLKFSTLRSRIMMMNKEKTSRFHLLKFVLLVPITVLVLLAFRNSNDTGSTMASTEKTPVTETYTLSTLTYSIPDEKVKMIVLKEKDKSLLKPGDFLNLTMLHDEKARLKNLLEKNGYSNLKTTAIRFMIDSASVNNSFSIEIKISLDNAIAMVEKKQFRLIKGAGSPAGYEPPFLSVSTYANPTTQLVQLRITG